MLALYYKAQPRTPVIIDMPQATAEQCADHINSGGRLFEWEGVLYPCREWVVEARAARRGCWPPATPPSPQTPRAA